MTDEELDRARGIEARRRAIGAGLRGGPYRGGNPEALVAVSEIAARLAREGWTPEDPLLKEAREVCAAMHHLDAPGYLSGKWDGTSESMVAIAALRRGIEIGKAEALKPGGVTFFK